MSLVDCAMLRFGKKPFFFHVFLYFLIPLLEEFKRNEGKWEDILFCGVSN